MLKIENLTKKYGDLTVYENFNLEIQEGEITCILGASGSGKTTLLNCIANLTDYGGEVPKIKCSYIFQTPRLVPNLTVRKNLRLVSGDEEKIDKVLRDVKLTDKADSYPAELSGGQAQRVAIARALVFNGDMLLMDEPFSSLDLKLKHEIFKLFKALKEEYKITALLVTHDVAEAASLADRVIVLDGGKIKADLRVDECEREEIGKQLEAILIN